MAYRCSSTRVRAWTRSPARRAWRAGTSLRSAGARRGHWGGCTPSVWSRASCAGRKCSLRGWPWKGCSAPFARGMEDPRSKDSRCLDSRWCSLPLCTRRARTCKTEKPPNNYGLKPQWFNMTSVLPQRRGWRNHEVCWNIIRLCERCKRKALLFLKNYEYWLST